MKKILLVFICFTEVSFLYSQTDSITKSAMPVSAKSPGSNKFTVLGNAEATYTATKGGSSFGGVNFKLIFLWKISD